MCERQTMTTRGWALGLVMGCASAASPSHAEAPKSYRFAVVVEASGVPPALTARLETAVSSLLGEVPSAVVIARDDVRSALADARTETNQKCASGKLDSRCQIALGKGLDANYVAKLEVMRQGKSCDVVLSVFSIAEETQQASAGEFGTSCDGDALTKGLRGQVDKVAAKLGLGVVRPGGGGDTAPLDLGGAGVGSAGETDFDRQLQALEARRRQEEATWAALTKELPKLGAAAQRSKLEAYLKLVGDSGPHADEARTKLSALSETEASSKLAKLRPLLGGSAPLEDKRKLVASFVAQYPGTPSAVEAEALLAEAEQALGSADMVSVPDGKFFMGCNASVDSECDDDEKPGRQVEVRAFRIDRTEVTVAAYRRCVDAGVCSAEGLHVQYWDGKEQGGEFCNWDKADRSNHPINCVDWSMAERYCRWQKKRLPTEAEWEKAARGTDGRKYPWGNAGYGATRVANIADATAKRAHSHWTVAENYDDGAYLTAPVSSYPGGRSPYGADDMIGNVWEWSSGWYEVNEYRSYRGGSWRGMPSGARASDRAGNGPAARFDAVGFRCAQ